MPELSLTDFYKPETKTSTQKTLTNANNTDTSKKDVELRPHMQADIEAIKTYLLQGYTKTGMPPTISLQRIQQIVY
jgi:hypothetical protein